jgi:hypothetical protein
MSIHFACAQVRTISTVHEIHEALREFAPNRGDFETLKLGPLTKLPLIYDFFKFPPDAEICEITTADVIEYLREFLTEKNAWTTALNLEELLKFMVEKRGLENPYELGLRIKSPPLAIQVFNSCFSFLVVNNPCSCITAVQYRYMKVTGQQRAKACIIGNCW